MHTFPLKRRQTILLAVTLMLVFVLVYQPHLTYPFPFHVDEWHHISEGLRLGNYGEYFQMLQQQAAQRFNGTEIGFHFLIFLISFIADPVAVYQYLPALWAMVAAATLFYVVYEKTGRDFLTAWLAVVFFASIKSNVNITGLWFFTPLTFAIPFIYLYAYFLTEGIERRRKKFILYGFGIMLFLLIIHSISVLFILPALVVYLCLHWRYVVAEVKFFSLFLVIPLLAVIFYKYTLDVPWPKLLAHIGSQLQFRYGWGVLELKNSLFEVYSWFGYVVAIAGMVMVFVNRQAKKYALYLLWPLTTFIMVIIYRMTGVSFVSPYQRNLYYLAIALPLFSAIGLSSTLAMARSHIESWRLHVRVRHLIVLTAMVVTLAISMIFVFINYYTIPTQIDLYRVINQNDYEALQFLAKWPNGLVMATPFVSTALYPITRDEPVGSVAFYGDRKIVEDFFLASDCDTRLNIINLNHVKYVISPVSLDTCIRGDLIFKNADDYIYIIR